MKRPASLRSSCEGQTLKALAVYPAVSFQHHNLGVRQTFSLLSPSPFGEGWGGGRSWRGRQLNPHPNPLPKGEGIWRESWRRKKKLPCAPCCAKAEERMTRVAPAGTDKCRSRSMAAKGE